MRLRRWAGTVLTAALLAGCAPKRAAVSDPVAPPASPETLRTIREHFQQADPDARVGVVVATLPESRLAAVADVEVREFREGDAITFIDTMERTLVNGRILEITNNQLNVKYEKPGSEERAPREGDLAVRLKLTP
jgi:hypothetical protein